MILIIGLGNPGKQYEKTWHNIGFAVLDYCLQTTDYGFSDWKLNKKFHSEIAKGEIGREKILLLKPQTFMNNSGEAVAAAARFFKIKPENIWLVHDDLDLPLGKIKIQKNRSSAGHNGVQSIIDCLGTKNFVRFRIGIAPIKPTRKSGADFVLSNFAKNELPLLDETLSKARQAILEKIKRES